MPQPDDGEFMGQALALAERGRATVRPNPLVGCVIVRGDRVVGEGWHERAGGPHAEVAALRRAGSAARGATAYVTLEPCDHQGRTPPCVAALLQAGVGRVVYATADPNPLARGGVERLRASGVEVRGGIRADDARSQNEVFFHVHTAGRPFVTLKLAQTLDGRVAARDGSSRWITSRQARTAGHALRASADAVLVGSGTVAADDPDLGVRHVDAPLSQPRPVVLDARGRTRPAARAVRPGTIVVTSTRSPSGWREALLQGGAEVVLVGETATGLDLRATLSELLARDVHAVLCEGGPTLAGSLVRTRLVDRLVLHVAPALLGSDGIASVGGPGAATLSDRWRWRIERVAHLGPDLEVVARPAQEPQPAATSLFSSSDAARS